jgi:hypothetical protein
MKPVLLLVLAASLVSPIVPAGEKGAEEGTRGDWKGASSAEEEWHLVLIGDAPAGYLRLVRQVRPGGERVTTFAQKLVLKRGATPVEIETSTTYEEDPGGALRGFRHTQKLSQATTVSTGKIEGDALVIRDSIGDAPERESRLEVEKGAVGPQRAEELMREKLRSPGDSLEVVFFFPEVRRFGKQVATLRGVESVSCRGPARSLRRLTIAQDVLPGVTTEEWVDEEFRLHKSSMAVFGLNLATCRSTLEEVLAQDFSSPPEIFLASSVPTDRRVPGGARRAVYRLVTKGDSLPIPEGSFVFRATGQKLLREEGARQKTLEVRSVLPAAPATRPVRPAPELEEYLRPNLYIQSDDAKIREIAGDVVAGEEDAWKASRALEKWVYRNLRKKNLNTAFAPAAEVARTKEGDCTEHAVLLAALLRAAGIPSRVVAGIVYHDGAFVGHMWTEARTDAWTPLDATLGEGEVPADRIALSAGSLDSSSVADFFLGMVPVLGNLRIEVLEVES